MSIEVKRIPSVLRGLAAAPAVTIHMWGNEKSAANFKFFTQRHPRYLIIRNKTLGAALLPLPASLDIYLKGSSRQVVRTNRRKALAAGYRFSSFVPVERVQQILDINRSLDTRQGRPMDSSYLSEDSLHGYLQQCPLMYGVFDSGGMLKAYADAPICGEVMILSRLLGHGESLDAGIMYLLITGVLSEAIQYHMQNGYPGWLQYDMMFGAASGLRYFKERLGFRPYRVKWRWGMRT